MKKVIFFFVLSVYLNAGAQVIEQPSQKMQILVGNLMKRMTLEEKIGQLNLPGSVILLPGRQAIRI